MTTEATRGEITANARSVGAVPALGAAARTTLVVCGPVAAVVWWVTDHAAVVPVTLVGGIAIAAAITDRATGHIPNALVLAGLVIVGCGWGFVGAFDNRMMDELARDIAAGVVLSGAPLLFAIWLVAPRLIGGGDWKLLAVMGAAIGYLDPALAALIGVIAFGTAIVVAAVTRQRQLALGPMLALGYWAAVGVAAMWPSVGGPP